MQTDKKICVFGASGQVGYQLCQCLDNKGISFKACCKTDTKHKDNLQKLKSMKSGGKTLEVCDIDWTKPDSIRECIKDCDKIFLKTPIGKTVEAVRCFCDCIKDCKDKIQTLVYFSVMEAEEKRSEMGSEFCEGEDLLKGLGLNNLIIIRSTFLFSNFLIDCKNIKEKNCLCRPLGQNCVNIVSDHDVAECCCQCLLSGAAQGKKCLNIGGKECLTMTDVCKYLGDKLGKKIEYKDCGLDEFEKYLGGTGLSREGIQSYLGLMRAARDGLYNKKLNDFNTLLGKDPMSFQEMLQKEIECFK